MELGVMEGLTDWESCEHSWASMDAGALDDVQPTGCFPDNCFPYDVAKVPDKPCALFDVLGTEDTWQGKHFYQICINGRPRDMLNLLRWPLVHIISKLTMPQLGVLAMTCRSFRKPALCALEERAHKLLVSRYFDESQCSKFIDAFANYDWAMSLSGFLTPATIANWRAEELDAICQTLFSFVEIEGVSLLHGLQPEAARRWKTEGRRALQLFVDDCVTSKASFCKMLMHYNHTWLSIRKIMEMNANLLLAILFENRSAVVRKIKASWPLVTVEAEVASPSKHSFGHDMSIWSPAKVYQWVRLKKMPVRGLLDLQPNGADLLQWIAQENTAGAPSRLSALPPLGLGMSSIQRSRFVFLVNQVGITKPRKTHAEVFTFRFAERVDSRGDTEHREGSAVAAPPAGSTPCQSWSSV